jgi:hypothetical protein
MLASDLLCAFSPADRIGMVTKSAPGRPHMLPSRGELSQTIVCPTNASQCPCALVVEPQQVVLGHAEAADGWVGF